VQSSVPNIDTPVAAASTRSRGDAGVEAAPGLHRTVRSSRRSRPVWNDACRISYRSRLCLVYALHLLLPTRGHFDWSL